MAIACTAYKFWATEASAAVNPDLVQYMQLTLTGGVGDVAWDVNDVAGTFWGDVDGTATGLAALGVFKSIIPFVRYIKKINSPFLMARLRVAVGAPADASDYAQAFTTADVAPSWTFHAGDGGPTAEVLTISWVMKSGWLPITLNS